MDDNSECKNTVSEHTINDIWTHIETTNTEMGKVKEDIAVLKNDTTWLKQKLDSVDKKQWYMLTGIISILVAVLSQIILKVI